MIVDYWLVRNQRLALPDLYRTKGIYSYSAGWNWRAVIATLIGCALAWIGLVVPTLRPLYDYGWFIGFGASGLSYLVLMKLSPPLTATVAAPDVA
jgi:NCS1 family nucleobase:cation symporter-1